MRLDLTVNSIRYNHIFERKSQWYCKTMTIKEVSLHALVAFYVNLTVNDMH